MGEPSCYVRTQEMLNLPPDTDSRRYAVGEWVSDDDMVPEELEERPGQYG